MYVPDVVVIADVQPERLSKSYHRKWYKTTGKYHALMHLQETIGYSGEILEKPLETVRLFGAPAFLYRELMSESLRCAATTVCKRESISFKHENRVRYLLGYIGKCYEQEFASRDRSHILELGRFTKAMLRKKFLALFAGTSRRI
jgi:hypothetical protein